MRMRSRAMMCWYVVLLFMISWQTVSMMEIPLESSTEPGRQQQAVMDLIRRTLPDNFHKFQVMVQPNLGPRYRSSFRLESAGGLIMITANDGVSAAWGFHYYLKHYCHCHLSLQGNQLNLPRPLPQLPPGGVQVTSKDQFRYYANVCTFSYSFVWWNWTQWEIHIDWMAMNAINLPLAFTGQEAVWSRVYRSLGLTQQEVDVHFAGPAFLAWSRMGNIQSWGGPLPRVWIDNQLLLQKRILARMREFGMMPVLPGFAGHVPEAITRVFPQASVTRLPTWSHFNTTYSATLLLDARDPLFQRIGNLFITEMQRAFGTNHLYNADPFNEMVPESSETEYLKQFGHGLFSAMTQADNRAIWVLQAWMFSFSKTYWQKPQVKALLTSVPLGRMLVLDLYAEQAPAYRQFDSYFGQPFIWCMLLNFGDVSGYYGQIENVNVGPTRARAMTNSTMVGVGLSMEGISQNYVMFEFLLEKGYTDSVDINEWMSQFARRRYGRSVRKLSDFWQKAAATVLNKTDGVKNHGQFIIMKRPSLHGRPNIWYEPRAVLVMWRKALQAVSGASGPLFQYDLVDVTRQALTVASINIYHQILQSYQRKNITKLRESTDQLITLMNDLDEILSSNEYFLLGRWLEGAKIFGESHSEKSFYEFNARNQITLWGPNGEISDYAKKQWSGLLMDYYRPRWQLFASYLIQAVESGRKFIHEVFKRHVLEQVEKPFSYATKVYPTEPVGNSFTISQRLYHTYKKFLSSHKIPNFANRQRRIPSAEKRKGGTRGRKKNRNHNH